MAIRCTGRIILVVDAGVILAVAFGNALIGFIQEARAENAIAALTEVVTTEATVIRADVKVRISLRELVPGDLTVLSAGDRVPADVRLVEVYDLKIDESSLTGESLPVEKTTDPLATDTPLSDRTNMAYAGSLVTAGQVPSNQETIEPHDLDQGLIFLGLQGMIDPPGGD